jgi:hypothetical protein
VLCKETSPQHAFGVLIPGHSLKTNAILARFVSTFKQVPATFRDVIEEILQRTVHQKFHSSAPLRWFSFVHMF